MLSKKTLAAPFLISSLLLVSCSDSSSNTTSSSNDLSGSFQKENYVDEGAMEKCRKLFFKAQYQQGSTSRIYIDPQTNKITRAHSGSVFGDPDPNGTDYACFYNYAVFGKSTKVDWCKSPIPLDSYKCNTKGERFWTIQIVNNNDPDWADPQRYPLFEFVNSKARQDAGAGVARNTITFAGAAARY